MWRFLFNLRPENQSLNVVGKKPYRLWPCCSLSVELKTIPFVNLDGEAALDEANVKRLGDYLNRLDKDMQLIVVTHRKGTMAAADSSSMELPCKNPGVSKIVSVKLKI